MSDGSNFGFPPPGGFPPPQSPGAGQGPPAFPPPTGAPAQMAPPAGPPQQAMPAGQAPGQAPVPAPKGVSKAVVAVISGLVCLLLGASIGYILGRASTDSFISFTDDNGGDVAFGGGDPATQSANPSSTRESPVPLGDTVEIGNGWSVRVISYDSDATEKLSDANEFNDPPGPDQRWVVIELEVTNVSGKEPESPFFGLDIGLLGSDNVKRTSMDGFCNALEPQFSDNAELYRGGSESGSMCLVVGAAEADSMVLVASPSFEDENSSFLALR